VITARNPLSAAAPDRGPGEASEPLLNRPDLLNVENFTPFSAFSKVFSLRGLRPWPSLDSAAIAEWLLINAKPHEQLLTSTSPDVLCDRLQLAPCPAHAGPCPGCHQ